MVYFNSFFHFISILYLSDTCFSSSIVLYIDLFFIHSISSIIYIDFKMFIFFCFFFIRIVPAFIFLWALIYEAFLHFLIFRAFKIIEEPSIIWSLYLVFIVNIVHRTYTAAFYLVSHFLTIPVTQMHLSSSILANKRKCSQEYSFK